MAKYLSIAIIIALAALVGGEAFKVLTDNFAEIHFGVDVIFNGGEDA